MQTSLCPDCGQPVRAGARYCAFCGHAQPLICPGCGVANRATARFCTRCGSSLAAAALHNRYLIHQTLHKGGQGAVHLAGDTALFNRRCVVKEMLGGRGSPAELAEAGRNFQREAELLAQLNHPAIPRIYDYFVEGGRYYLVMEYVEGESLGARLTRVGRMDEDEALRYVVQVSNVLVYLHGQTPPVVHRDVKPDNIILSGDPPQAVLVDFGVAKTKSGTGQDTTAWGTRGYTAPEQAQGHAEPASDVYGLAVTAYRLFAEDDPEDHPFQFPKVDALPPRLQSVLGRALALNPRQRPQVQELSQTLASMLAPAAPSSLRLVDAQICASIDRATERPVGPATTRFKTSASAMYIYLRLANQDQSCGHQHTFLAQFFSPDGQFYRARSRKQPVMVAAGQAEVNVALFGLYITGKEVAKRPGKWRAIVYLDEQKLIELAFEIVR